MSAYEAEGLPGTAGWAGRAAWNLQGLMGRSCIGTAHREHEKLGVILDGKLEYCALPGPQRKGTEARPDCRRVPVVNCGDVFARQGRAARDAADKTRIVTGVARQAALRRHALPITHAPPGPGDPGSCPPLICTHRPYTPESGAQRAAARTWCRRLKRLTRNRLARFERRP